MKKLAVTATLTALLLISTASADRGHRHPNLARAQHDVDAAIVSVTAAQRANEFDLGGHASKAKALLEEAKAELHEAAQAADR